MLQYDQRVNLPNEYLKSLVIKLENECSILLETKDLENDDKNHEQEDKVVIIEQEKKIATDQLI